MYSFYNETIDAIKESGHKVGDIIWIGLQNGRVKFDIHNFLNEIQSRKAYPMDLFEDDFAIMFGDGSYLCRTETYSDDEDASEDVYTMGYWKFYTSVREPINLVKDISEITKKLDETLVYKKSDDDEEISFL